jgi:hypothetical protein
MYVCMYVCMCIYVYCTTDSPSPQGTTEVARDLLKYLSTHHRRNWLISQEIRSHLVEGQPFVHDLSIYPSKKVCAWGSVRGVLCVGLCVDTHSFA